MPCGVESRNLYSPDAPTTIHRQTFTFEVGFLLGHMVVWVITQPCAQVNPRSLEYRANKLTISVHFVYTPGSTFNTIAGD